MTGFSSHIGKLKYIALIIIVLYVFVLMNLSSLKPKENVNLDQEPHNRQNEKSGNYLNENSKQIKNSVIQFKREVLDWKKLSSNVYILEAYLDKRKTEIFIRILTILVTEETINCKINNGDQKILIPSVAYEFNENHGMQYKGFIHSCKLPPSVHDVSEVTVQTDKGSLNLQLIKLEIVPKPQYTFSVCVPPLHGSISKESLVAFIEMSRILGAEHFNFYIFGEINNDAKIVLSYYENIYIASVSIWSVPSDDIWYNGQMSNIHHCLYKTIGHSSYTVFQDIDELLVPLLVNSWTELMVRIDKQRDHCGYKVSSIFMSHVAKQPSLFLESQTRKAGVNRFRSKCIVRPELIFEQGIHHVSKQNVEEMTPKSADPKEVLLFHYRSCDSMFGFDCSTDTLENSLFRFKKKFAKNYFKVSKELSQMV